MVYKDRNAVYALNSYLWKLLEANLGLTTADYQGAKPIIPASQQPELMTFGKPFVVYGSAVHAAQHLYALRSESVAYNIYSTSVTEANKIANLLVDCFERQDEAADDVNVWLGTEGNDRGISFATVKLSMVERAEPADEEGGFVSSLVLLEVKYTVTNQGVIGAPVFTGFEA